MPVQWIALRAVLMHNQFLVAAIIRTVTGFIDRDDPTAYFGETQTSLYVLRSALLTLQTLIGDGFLVRLLSLFRFRHSKAMSTSQIYRLKIVWNDNLWLLVPAIIFGIGDALAGSGALHSVATASSAESVFQLKKWIVAFFAMTLATNGLCTSMSPLPMISVWSCQR